VQTFSLQIWNQNRYRCLGGFNEVKSLLRSVWNFSFFQLHLNSFQEIDLVSYKSYLLLLVLFKLLYHHPFVHLYLWVILLLHSDWLSGCGSQLRSIMTNQ
jgi:hypothetical protein